MTAEEMRELDVFCVVKVLKLKQVKTILELVPGAYALLRHGENKGTVFVHESMNNIKPFKPTVNPADAMAVLEACIVKLGQDEVRFLHGTHPLVKFGVYHVGQKTPTAAETLSLAIARFARALYSK